MAASLRKKMAHALYKIDTLDKIFTNSITPVFYLLQTLSFKFTNQYQADEKPIPDKDTKSKSSSLEQFKLLDTQK